MTESFDYDAFDWRFGNILIKSLDNPFDRLNQDIEDLRQEYQTVQNETARRYVTRAINDLLLRVAITTSRPSDVVADLYKNTIREGFNDLAREVNAAIEYANYCNDQGDPATGLSVLNSARESISFKVAPGKGQCFLQAIEKMQRFLKRYLDSM